jgi:hypothetical protein
MTDTTPTRKAITSLYQAIATHFPDWEAEIGYNAAHFVRADGAEFRLMWLPFDGNPREISLSGFEPDFLDAPQESVPYTLPDYLAFEWDLPLKEILDRIRKDYLFMYLENFNACIFSGDQKKVTIWQENLRQIQELKTVIAAYPALSHGFSKGGKRYSLEIENPERDTALAMKGEKGMDTVSMNIRYIPVPIAAQILKIIGDSLD